MSEFIYEGNYPNEEIAGVITFDDIEFDPLDVAITPRVSITDGVPVVHGWKIHKRTKTNIAADITGEHKVVPAGALEPEDVY